MIVFDMGHVGNKRKEILIAYWTYSTKSHCIILRIIPFSGSLTMLIIVYICQKHFHALQKKKQKSNTFSKGRIISWGIVIGVIVLAGVFTMNSFSPVNSDTLVFASSSNVFLKAVKSTSGNYHFQYAKGGKAMGLAEGTSPPISVSQGNLIQLHLINEDKNQQNNQSRHNVNIDEFNVHTKDLGYFQTETITFLADKGGTFDYYCTINPDMKGTITVN